jgi:cation diffusion facilitator family transporter
LKFDSLLQNRVKAIQSVTWIGLWVNLALSILKFIGGTLGHSQAVIADGVHSLSDISTDIAILVGVQFWSRPADKEHPHGHHRLETLITAGIGVSLLAVAAGLLYNAVLTLPNENVRSPGWWAFFAALTSFFTKEALYHYTVAKGKDLKSMALIANAWHHRSDALSSLPVVLAVFTAILAPSWVMLDAVGAIMVCLIIMRAGFKISVTNLNKLMDVGASQNELEEISAIVKATGGVQDFHKIRTRYVGASSLAVDLHIQVNPELTVREGHQICGHAKSRILHSNSKIMDVLVHLEPYEEED